MALIHNVNRGKGARALSVEDVHPHRQRRRAKLTPQSLRALKPVFDKGKW